MNILAIIDGLLRVIPAGAQFVQDYRATLATQDQATLDAMLASADRRVTADHDALDAVLHHPV